MTIDGRVARGESSRAALIAATLRLLEHGGPQAVTHRAVAREAGISAQAVTYHFGTIDDLFVSAMQSATSHWPDLMRQADTGSRTRDLAAVLLGEAHDNRALLIAEVELYLLAARRPSLRPAARAWADAVADMFEGVDGLTRLSLVAAMDGLCVQLLIADEPMSLDDATAIFDRALTAAP